MMFEEDTHSMSMESSQQPCKQSWPKVSIAFSASKTMPKLQITVASNTNWLYQMGQNQYLYNEVKLPWDRLLLDRVLIICLLFWGLTIGYHMGLRITVIGLKI